MFDIVATDAAERDLVEIREYIFGKLRNLQAWENLDSKIREAFGTLKRQPYAFVSCRDARLKQLGYRKCSLGSYLFVYRVDEANSRIHVIRFFHELQDYEAQF